MHPQWQWKSSVASLVAIAALVACNDAPQEPRLVEEAEQVAIRIVSGDHQLGIEGESLDDPIVVEVRDAGGAPVRNAEVKWAVTDAGSITPAVSRTDDQGRASARWQLGGLDEHEGSARVGRNVAVAFTAAEPVTAPVELLQASVLQPRTYEGSRQTVHPDFVRTPEGWGAYALHLAITPYPSGVSQFENPSLFVSRSGMRWFTQAGVLNPLAKPSAGYLSDPDILYVAESRELWMYYRQVDSKNRILLVKSKDGVTWSDPIATVDGPNHTIISPSIVRRARGDWQMWSVNGAAGCNALEASVELRTSRNGINWSAPSPVTLRNRDRMPWHIDVQYVAELGEYWAIYPVKIGGSCQTRAVYLASSKDGRSWTTYPSPVLEAGELPELKDIVYRSTFEYDAASGEFRFWFSGANAVGNSYNWRTVFQRRTRSSVMARISGTAPAPVPTPLHTLPEFSPP